MKYKCVHCKSEEVTDPTILLAVTTQGPSEYDDVECVVCKCCGLATPTWAAEVKE